MVKNEEYIKILKSMISCVSHGDYYSVKELSYLELENWRKKEEKIKNEIKEMSYLIKNYKNKTLEELNTKEIMNLMNLYSYYIVNKVSEDVISFEEFIDFLLE